MATALLTGVFFAIIGMIFVAGWGLGTLIALAPWRWVRYAIGWPLGIGLAIAMLFAGPQGQWAPSLAILFATGLCVGAFARRPRPLGHPQRVPD